MTYQQKQRTDYFYCISEDGKTKEQRNVMRFDSTVKIRSGKGFSLSKKQLFIVKLLQQMPETCTQSIDSLTSAWLKEQRKNGNFASGDVINGADIKKAIQFIYINYEKLFELYQNSKGNFLIKQVPYIEALTTLKIVKA
ncbi:MAG: hypothetical protein J6P07_00630 [Spirochaetaceae bacterium]|nr:hypothetical protein [Spirochaetaceae bacterium]MBO7731893.1 hypothetical protein [Methanobrevibacter sp.]